MTYEAVPTGELSVAGDPLWIVRTDGWQSRHQWVRERYARRYADLLNTVIAAVADLDESGHLAIGAAYALAFDGAAMFDPDPDPHPDLERSEALQAVLDAATALMGRAHTASTGELRRAKDWLETIL